jgi:hypothetical protein
MSTEDLSKSSEPSTKWPELPWDKVVDRAERIVFRIHAGQSSGTCFVVSLGKQQESEVYHYMLATAWHVVKDIAGSNHELQFVAANGKTVYEAKAGHYGIFRLGSEHFDTAVIWINSKIRFVAQEDLLPLLDYDLQMPRGVELGWVGFPGIVSSEFCFFKGSVSGYLHDPPTYLIDGVAVNGVSGGPALDNRAHIIGLVSSYIPNQVDEYTTLPGLLTLIPISAIRYWIQNRVGARVI